MLNGGMSSQNFQPRVSKGHLLLISRLDHTDLIHQHKLDAVCSALAHFLESAALAHHINTPAHAHRCLRKPVSRRGRERGVGEVAAEAAPLCCRAAQW
eukprot:scaffold326190_cov53-Tisochrysis_lutea.AAC.1